MALNQGLQYVREHPAQREDERIQRYLWLDQWMKVLEDKNRMTPEMAREFWGDLTGFVKDEPPMSVQGLDRVTQGAQTKLGKNIAHFYLYQNLLKEQSLEPALKSLEQVEDDKVTDLYAKSQNLLELVKNKSVSESRKIGVLLPLSGELRPLAEEVLEAIQVASSLGYAAGVEFVIEDTGTSEADLLKAWEKLALQERVVAIIGPLTSTESEIVFERAEIVGVPVVSLAPREGLQGFGTFSFRSVLTLEDQVKRVAKFISDDLKAKRVAVLLPDSPYGWDVMEVAHKEFENKGLSIAQLQVYRSGSTDFKEPLRKMTRLDIPRIRKNEVCPKELKEGETPPENCVKRVQELKPLIDFEVLFVPDGAETAGFLLPTLPYLRIYGVQVVGLSLYNSPKLIERAGDSAEGVVFADGYLPSSLNFSVRFFREHFMKLTQKEPSRLSAEAFDAAMVMIHLMRELPGSMTRELMVEKLKGVRDFPGVTGSIYAEAQKLKKEPKLLIVRNGSFQEMKEKD